MEQFFFDKWPDRPFYKVEPTKEGMMNNESGNRGGKSHFFWIPILYICFVISIVYSLVILLLNVEGGYMFIALSIGGLCLVAAIILSIFSASDEVIEYRLNEHNHCLKMVEAEIGESIESIFDIYRSNMRDVDIIILKPKNSEYINNLLTTLSKKQEWPIQEDKGERIVESKHYFDDGVFTSWRKNFDSSNVCGVIVEVQFDGNNNEITYKSIIY